MEFSHESNFQIVVQTHTLPETGVAPENRLLEKEIPIGNHHVQVRAVSFREGIFPCTPKPYRQKKCQKPWIYLPPRDAGSWRSSSRLGDRMKKRTHFRFGISHDVISEEYSYI